MPYWFEGVLMYVYYLMSIGNTVSPGCECVIYQSYGTSSGRFTSPNFPQYYPRDSTCILYTFIGDVGEIVELTFLEFDMKQPTANNVCSDFLRLFLYLDGPEVNEHDRHTKELCGHLNSTEKKYYSSDRALILELHADGLPGNYTGFLGRYKFLDKNSDLYGTDKSIWKDQYMIEGKKMAGTQCTYYFDSNITKSGRLFSPFYPQNYKPSSKCQYHFQARQGDRVKIFFENIQLYPSGGRGESSCRYSPDAIVVYNGRDKSAEVIGHYCDIQNQVELISSGRHLFIEFYSDSQNEAQGFAAKYNFIGTGPRSVTTQPIPYHEMDGPHVTYRPRPTYSPRDEVNCNEEINSQIHKNGSIQSPFHPGPYASGVTCTYTFVGSGRERVQLRFVHMDLFFNGGNPTEPIDCAGSDSVKIMIPLHGELKELGSYCGKKLPPALMSAGNSMTVSFHSESSSKGVTTGFKAMYSFVKNFGITTGQPDSRGVCSFKYYSYESAHGSFTSPNYPGLYPRNTECHYLFFGKGKETVQITFAEFQVDGIAPKCGQGTHSDYVSFSNFAKAEDRKLHRLCGVIDKGKKKSIESDGPFFRVVFKSNEIYDAEGFFAYYQFKGADNPHPRTAIDDETNQKQTAVGMTNSGQRLENHQIVTCLILTFTFIALGVNH